PPGGCLGPARRRRPAPCRAVGLVRLRRGRTWSCRRRRALSRWCSTRRPARPATRSRLPLRLQSLDLVVDVEPGLLQVLNLRVGVLVPRSGDVLDCVATGVVEPLVGDEVDDLDLASVVVAGVVDRIILD